MVPSLRFVGGGLALGLLLVASLAAMATVSFLGVDKKAKLVNNNTAAIVTGAVVCSVGFTAAVSAVILQNRKQLNIAGTGTQEDLDCIGVSQPFAVQVLVVNPPNQTFKKGPGSAIVGVNTNDGFGNSDSQTATTVIQLAN